MDLEAFLQSLTNDDFEWVVPMGLGVVIVVGSLLIAIVRGMTSGVIVALLFGGLLSLSPLLLNNLERTAAEPAPDAADGASELAVLNSEAIEALADALASLQSVLASPDSPFAAAIVDDVEAQRRLQDGATALGERVEAARSAIMRAEGIREDLASPSAD